MMDEVKAVSVESQWIVRQVSGACWKCMAHDLGILGYKLGEFEDQVMKSIWK